MSRTPSASPEHRKTSQKSAFQAPKKLKIAPFPLKATSATAQQSIPPLPDLLPDLDATAAKLLEEEEEENPGK